MYKQFINNYYLYKIVSLLEAKLTWVKSGSYGLGAAASADTFSYPAVFTSPSVECERCLLGEDDLGESEHEAGSSEPLALDSKVSLLA